MGVLREAGTENRVTLRSRHLVGRSRACDLRLRDRRTSSEHATLWYSDGWWVRDLGATNGTFADGERLAAGAVVALSQGATLDFGGERPFVLESDDPPVAMARVVDGNARVLAADATLVLPDEATPELVLVQRDDGAWVRATDGEADRLVVDLGLVQAGGRTWRLHLPEPHVATEEAGLRTLSLSGVTVRFRVSRDEEHVAITLDGGGRQVELPERAFWYMLLTLCRLRRDDSERGVEDPGWQDRDELCRMLRMSPEQLSVDIFRARALFKKAGLQGARDVVERRPGLLRTGIAHWVEAPP